MSDYDESKDVHLTCNKRVGTRIKLQGMKPMGLSEPWTNYLEIIVLQKVKIVGDGPNDT